MEKLFNLNQKLILVTGSYRGLGLAIAEGLARAGARVVLNGRNADAVEDAVAAFAEKGLSATGCVFDVTDKASIDNAVTELEKREGKPDVLFNNAGIIERAPLLETTEESWRRVLDTNLTGAFLVAQRVVPGMVTRGRGKVVNTCSLLSAVARDTVASYAAAKSGLKLLTQSMATEWAKFNIQANAIGPGYFNTELTRPLQENAEFDGWVKKRVPAGRWGEPDELVGPAVFLASDASNFVNGQIIYVDGGLLAQM